MEKLFNGQFFLHADGRTDLRMHFVTFDTFDRLPSLDAGVLRVYDMIDHSLLPAEDIAALIVEWQTRIDELQALYSEKCDAT